MKSLYISDLDGTLLDSNACVSEYTARSINGLIAKGMKFSFATARSVYSARALTADINLDVPYILMNGVSIYEPCRNVYVKNEYIPVETSRRIVRIFEENNIRFFMYNIHDDILTAYFTEFTSTVMESFAESRKKNYNKPFVQCDSLMEKACEETVYINTTGEYGELLTVRNAVAEIDGADCTFYEDTYTGKWFLEIFSQRASKANGIKYLRNEYGFDNVVCFGDNLNDLPMFAESDIRVAVGNAKPELLKCADYVTLNNDDNGVAKWLECNFK